MSVKDMNRNSNNHSVNKPRILINDENMTSKLSNRSMTSTGLVPSNASNKYYRMPYISKNRIKNKTNFIKVFIYLF